ncbi:fibronectin type III domain-containing protein [Actinomycetes bacterium KLBMP 9797]
MTRFGATKMHARATRRTSAAAIIVLIGLSTVAAPDAAGAAMADRLPTPKTPSAVVQSPTSVALTWTAVAGPVAAYTVEVASPSTFVPILTTTALSATVTGLAPDRAHNFRLIARATPDSGLADSWPSTYTHVVTPPTPEFEPPTAPGSPTMQRLGIFGVSVTFLPATDNARVASYVGEVLRDGVWTRVATSPGTQMHLSGLTAATSYTLAVSAVDSSGNRSPRSEPLVFTTAPYTHLPQCLVTLDPDGPYYQLTVQVYNTTAAAVDQWAVTFRMPVAHTLTSPRLARDDADAVLSSEPGSSLPSGTETMFWSYVPQNGDATLPSDFAISGEPCTVQQV